MLCLSTGVRDIHDLVQREWLLAHALRKPAATSASGVEMDDPVRRLGNRRNGCRRKGPDGAPCKAS